MTKQFFFFEAGLRFVLLFGMFILSSSVKAEDFVLPVTVWNAQYRMGFISEVSNRFGADGDLAGLGRLNQTFDSKKITQFVPELVKLVDSLNRAHPIYRYGDLINLGNLEFHGSPEYQYSAMVLARGLTKEWTLGLAVPIIKYNSNVSVAYSGLNNTSQVQEQIMGEQNWSPALGDAFKRLSQADILTLFRDSVVGKGYKAVQPYSASFVGDAQLVSMWQYFSSGRLTLYNESALTLPTGPKPDPDNLLAPSTFGQTSFTTTFHQSYEMTSDWNAEATASYQYRFTDEVRMRVPKDKNDFLPDADRTATLRRKLGDVLTLGARSKLEVTSWMAASLGLERSYKRQDSYTGEGEYNYGILTENTESYWDRVIAHFQFSTVNLYLKKKFFAPMQIAYTYTDIIGGRNVERQLTNEIAFKMFF